MGLGRRRRHLQEEEEEEEEEEDDDDVLVPHLPGQLEPHFAERPYLPVVFPDQCGNRPKPSENAIAIPSFASRASGNPSSCSA